MRTHTMITQDLSSVRMENYAENMQNCDTALDKLPWKSLEHVFQINLNGLSTKR